jgi:hypothetical protein
MSREENYVWYKKKIGKSQSSTRDEERKGKVEKQWVLFGLLILFVPLFSLEIFLALSRGFLCGVMPPSNNQDLIDGEAMRNAFNGLSLLPWAQQLCAPVQ